ncbi:MAG: bifunctional glycosyltransferase/class I SAM-dependent methyltransferase [Verrucomicrobiota bacterium]|nr:bifunctional glycosyltransferase/class I SAM-dependent methyltransferase [Verrucomicrobiota bacterium]
MRLSPPYPLGDSEVDLNGKRLLIFIVAYNAETTIEKVLSRIPESLHTDDIEVLIIDDSSKDDTFRSGLRYQQTHSAFKITILRTPENQGYGGNQKLGYRYAIDNNFDFVALVHGDGQYAPEELPNLVAPLVVGDADAVFGSRMIDKAAARAGGMPLYKWIGNQVLTTFQNWMLKTALSEFHSGYRLYSTAALAQIPFEKNTNDFHFDTEIIIQLVLKNLHIAELPIPTYYGNEICHVNGMKYAWDVFKTMLRARLHQMNLFFDRKFDVNPPQDTYDVKLGFSSSHTAAIDAARQHAHVLDIGCGQGYVAAEFVKKGCRVTGMDRYVPADAEAPDGVDFIRWDLDRQEFPVNVSQFDQIFMLDIIEHLKAPEDFMDELRFATGCKRPEVVMTTANIGFAATRLMLLLGQFNYGKKGILDATHTRLFTFRSMNELLKQSGYKVLEMRGIPAPFPKALGDNFISHGLLRLNEALIRVSRGFFSYQIFIRAQALPTVNNLLAETIESSGQLCASAAEALV